MKSNLALVSEFLGDPRSVDQDIKALTGMGQPSVPPEIASKLPGWSLILCYLKTLNLWRRRKPGDFNDEKAQSELAKAIGAA